jgi:hypothetical protein
MFPLRKKELQLQRRQQEKVVKHYGQIVLGLFGRHAYPRKKFNLHTRLSLTKCIVLFIFKNKVQWKKVSYKS